jgi:putative ABC transport system ATP-binding protein
MQSPEIPLIELVGIQKVFVTDQVETHALTNIHLTVCRGEFLAIDGPSGSGKTTLLCLMGLVETPTAGQYRLQGDDVSRFSPKQRAELRNRQLGFIFQSFNLIGDLTIEENVELPLRYRGMKPADRRRRVAAALDRVGIAHRARHLPGQLSGGQQQRAAVARAIVGEPPLLLADEPTGNLDSQNGESTMLLLSELHRQGSTVCLVTHNPRYGRYASRTIHLSDGQIVAEEQAAPCMQSAGSPPLEAPWSP